MKEGLFEYLFGISSEEISEDVILMPFFSAKHFEPYCEVIKHFKGRLYSGALCKKENKHFNLIKCGIGSGMAGDSVMFLKDTSASNIVFIGSAGGLNGMRIGDIIVAGSAFDGEGFSRYHRKKEDLGDALHNFKSVGTDPELSCKVEEHLRKNNKGSFVLAEGSIFTVGSFAAETEDVLKMIEGSGALGVEMELSAVLQAAESSGKKASGIIYISDEPLRKPVWKEMEKTDKIKYNNSMDFVIKNVVSMF